MHYQKMSQQYTEEKNTFLRCEDLGFLETLRTHGKEIILYFPKNCIVSSVLSVPSLNNGDTIINIYNTADTFNITLPL